jgi:hypothetical protein
MGKKLIATIIIGVIMTFLGLSLVSSSSFYYYSLTRSVITMSLTIGGPSLIFLAIIYKVAITPRYQETSFKSSKPGKAWIVVLIIGAIITFFGFSLMSSWYYSSLGTYLMLGGIFSVLISLYYRISIIPRRRLEMP